MYYNSKGIIKYFVASKRIKNLSYRYDAIFDGDELFQVCLVCVVIDVNW